MSHEAVPDTHRHTGPTGQAAHAAHAAHDRAGQEPAVPAQGDGAPKGLLQQMEELMAALNADLSQLDADLQASTDRTPEGERPSSRSS
ncbi:MULTISPECIES: hypothetical protein [unclassified Streptomyces]|uniref:hypothetical protein n=1 Tax=unclassified Streptomyces TaxID=2593676 RepID=UPI000D6C4084|nr:hypothetical protein [Streptomyces sp. CG 926]PWK75067.1 hypothetical protein BCL76_101802 [Streptomyces sp. CG 926]